MLQAGAGQNPARQSAVGAGIPLTVPAITLNAVCLSGLEAVAEGARMIADGRARIVVAVGQESMSLAPHAWPGSRLGKRYGSIEFLDTMDHDGLTDAFEHRSMGASTEDRNEANHVTREEQDAWAALSHARLEAGADVPRGRDRALHDPGPPRAGRSPRTTASAPGTTVETLAALKPAFTPDGGITAGNSSQITDGAAAVVLMDESLVGPSRKPLARDPRLRLRRRPRRLPPRPARERGAEGARAGRPGDRRARRSSRSTRPSPRSPSSRPACSASIPLIVNMNGGAIALGHPIGASGTRIVGHVARSLAALGPGSLGVAAICGGGGQGAAIVLEGRRSA